MDGAPPGSVKGMSEPEHIATVLDRVVRGIRGRAHASARDHAAGLRSGLGGEGDEHELAERPPEGGRNPVEGVDGEPATPAQDPVHLPVVDLGDGGELGDAHSANDSPGLDDRADALPELLLSPLVSAHADRILYPVTQGLQVRSESIGGPV